MLDLIPGPALKMLGVLEDLHLKLKKHVCLEPGWALGSAQGLEHCFSHVLNQGNHPMRGNRKRDLSSVVLPSKTMAKQLLGRGG